jgi:murein DD-endopeptidase MepM/ murein hydrolase activator NlpD
MKVTESFMRDRVPTLLEQAMPSIEEWAARTGQSAPKGTGKSGKELLTFNFGVVNDLLRKESEIKLAALLKGPKYERLWSGAFEKPVGTIDTNFGELISYEYDGRVIGEALQTGYEIRMPSSQRDVAAMNDGLVIFSENIGTYGRTVGLDHGLGLVSIYAHLNAATVSKGDKVAKGQPIGEAGVTGLAQDIGVFIQLRLHGVPVDLVEWWDKEWYYNHIVEKINDVKKVLGVATFVPLDSALP